MARRDDLREVMRGLVAPESDEAADEALFERRKNNSAGEAGLTFSPAQAAVLSELCARLREGGIEASQAEIALTLLDGMARRPALCRGLLAEYLTG